MMKLRYSPSPDLSFEVEAGTMKEAFQAVFDLSEVFNERKCGCCGSTDVRFFVREDKDEHHYYKMACRSCPATFDFGQYKVGGGLFAKKWDKEARQPLPNGGWSVYTKDGDTSHAPDQRREADMRQQSQKNDPTQRWLDFFKSDPPLSDFNEFCEANIDAIPEVQQRHMRMKIHNHATQAGWVWSQAENCYVRGRP